jgi:co-chaperonin GroES (HSP10)
MTPLHHWILVEPDKEPTHIETPSGHKLLIGAAYEFNQEYGKSVNKWNTLQHAVTTGKIIATPKKLVLQEIEVEVDVKRGDIALFHYFQEIHAIGDGRHVGRIYSGCAEASPLKLSSQIFIDYNSIFAVVRDGKLIPVNGNIFVEASAPEEINTSLIVPDSAKPAVSKTKGKILYMGSPVLKYKVGPNPPDTNELKVGDEIRFHEANAILVEQDMHEMFEKGKTLYRMRRSDVECVCEAEGDTPVGNRVLIKLDAAPEKISQSLIANERYKQKPTSGIILKKGGAVKSLKVADKVCFAKGAAYELEEGLVSAAEQDVMWVEGV